MIQKENSNIPDKFKFLIRDRSVLPKFSRKFQDIFGGMQYTDGPRSSSDIVAIFVKYTQFSHVPRFWIQTDKSIYTVRKR